MKKVLSILLVLCFVFSIAIPVSADSLEDAPEEDDAAVTENVETEGPKYIFPDVPADSDYIFAVEALYDIGIFTGDGRGYFNPEKTITRAEAAAVICRILGFSDPEKRQVFTDVAASNWAAGYVAKASELGIIKGYGNGKFGPCDSVTYEQMLAMLIRSLGYDDEAVANGGWPNGYINTGKMLGISSSLSFTGSSPAPRKYVALFTYNATKIPFNDFGSIDD